jgi:CheY-like chemotaxis protein
MISGLTPIPTILITAYPKDGARERTLAAGVIGYLSKPFDEDDLLACVRSALTTGS